MPGYPNSGRAIGVDTLSTRSDAAYPGFDPKRDACFEFAYPLLTCKCLGSSSRSAGRKINHE